jgi:FKBP-type peptidyl-prolyl cis-trans isomerase FkpA
MKKTICALCLLVSALALYARGIREDVKTSEESARLGYAVGMVIGPDLKGLELDYTAVAEGLKAALAEGEAKMTPDEAMTLVEAALESVMDKQSETNRQKEAEFLERNGRRAEIQTTASGLQYEVLAEGAGEKPAAADTVRVNYTGALIDGTVFDSSIERGEPEEIPLEMVISGWTEGIQLMGVGGKYRFYIPSDLAYGKMGAGQIIPPYSTLIFDVELVEIVRDTEEEYEE